MCQHPIIFLSISETLVVTKFDLRQLFFSGRIIIILTLIFLAIAHKSCSIVQFCLSAKSQFVHGPMLWPFVYSSGTISFLINRVIWS